MLRLCSLHYHSPCSMQDFVFQVHFLNIEQRGVENPTLEALFSLNR